MRFLHAADLHLGLRVTRFGSEANARVQAARISALVRLVREAKDRGVDCVLIAGDLFDDNHVDATTSRRAYELFESIGKPVYIIPGNHDPWTADSVFARPPWNAGANGHVHVCQTSEPVRVAGATVYPCPLFAKNSLDDPTRMIPAREPGDASIRIGLAHGSLNDRATLHPDDHLIGLHTAQAKGLDYLALGHWHRPYRHRDERGVVRTVYPGVHEPMGFVESPEFSIGWSAYSNAAETDLFGDDGKGRVLLVAIDRAGAAPVIEEIDTGYLQWREETHSLRDRHDLDGLINLLDDRPDKSSQLLRLHLNGVLPASEMLRLDALDATLAGGQGGILKNFCWADLDLKNLHAEPTDEELREIAGDGVVRAVCDRLTAQTLDPDLKVQARARQSLLLLYRYAQEVRR